MEEISPALSAVEWAGVLALPAQLAAIRNDLLDTPFSAHAVAALLLYGEPFGFSAQDVEDETQVAAYCAATFRLLGERHRVRAAKIAALLPPPGTTGTTGTTGTPAAGAGG